MTLHAARLMLSLDPLIAEARRRARRRRVLVLQLAVAAAVITGTTIAVERSPGGAPQSAPTRLPSLLVNGGPHSAYRWKVRPAAAWILYTGDGSGRLGGIGGKGLAHPGHLTWGRWTETQATGSGVVWLYDQGSVRKDRVTVTAFRPINGHFTRLTLRYTDRGTHNVDTRSIGRTGSFWSYGIVRITTRPQAAGR